MSFNIDEIVESSKENRKKIASDINRAFENKLKFNYEPSSNISFLTGDFGKEFLEEYNSRVEKDYNNNSNLKVLNEYKETQKLLEIGAKNSFDQYSSIVKGSNPFAVVLANQILNEENLRTPTQADLEKALKSGFDLGGTYEDTALVLRNVKDSYAKNIPIARDLAYQLKERGAEISPENPLVLPLNQLTLQNEENDYGLTFKLKDNAKFYNAPILNSENESNFNSDNIDMEAGLPKSVGQGNRTLWTRGSGLSRLHLYYDLSVGSDNRSLDSSDGYGRVVVVKDEINRAEKQNIGGGTFL